MAEANIELGLIDRGACAGQVRHGLLQFNPALIKLALRGGLFFNQALAACQFRAGQFNPALCACGIGFGAVERGAYFAIINAEQQLPAIDQAAFRKMHRSEIAGYPWPQFNGIDGFNATAEFIPEPHIFLHHRRHVYLRWRKFRRAAGAAGGK